MAIIEFSEVTKTYGRPKGSLPALDRISLAVEPGDFTLLVGPSGAGKSTLLRLVLAMEQPDVGVIRIAGRDVSRLRRASVPYLRRNVGVVFQDFKLLPQATARENVALALHVLALPWREVGARTTAVLDRVGMLSAADRPVARLSGGEQQRVAIARAIAGDPAILLADEPTGNLDPELTLDILETLREVSRRGTTVVIATHDPLVFAHGREGRVLRLERGRLHETSERMHVVLPSGSGPAEVAVA